MIRKEMLDNFNNLSLSDVKTLTEQKHSHLSYNEMNMGITPYDGDMEWRDRINKNSPWANKNIRNHFDDKMIELHERLLRIGGVETCFPEYEEDIDNILTYGQLWDNITKRLKRGEASHCHSNSANLWLNNRNAETFKLIICTGYALSEDGIWRQHTWLIQAKARTNNLIETTEPRIAYYGFAMTDELAEEFEEENY